METTLVSTDPAPADRVAVDDTPPDLSDLNGFSSQDLADNRQGRLSPDQLLELRRAARGKLYELCAVVAFALVNLVVFHAMGMVVIMCGFVLYYVVRLVQRVDEYREGVVYEVVGDAMAQFVPDGEGPDRYWLHIGGLRLEMSRTQYLSFRSGGPYRVFYVGSTNTVIGGEVLPDWKPAPQPKAEHHWWSNFSISVE